MIDVFETYGASALSIGVIVVQVLSLMWMLILLLEYRHMYNKRLSILRSLRQEMPHAEVVGRKVLVVLYLGFTFGMTLMILFLYFVQPDIL